MNATTPSGTDTQNPNKINAPKTLYDINLVVLFLDAIYLPAADRYAVLDLQWDAEAA